MPLPLGNHLRAANSNIDIEDIGEEMQKPESLGERKKYEQSWRIRMLGSLGLLILKNLGESIIYKSYENIIFRQTMFCWLNKRAIFLGPLLYSFFFPFISDLRKLFGLLLRLTDLLRAS